MRDLKTDADARAVIAGHVFIQNYLDGTIALADDLLGQARLMRRGPARVPAPRSGFAGFQFPPDGIMIAVRWYLRYTLSYRGVEELLVERGIEVDHATIPVSAAVHPIADRCGTPLQAYHG
jgi:hypothetical protein